MTEDGDFAEFSPVRAPCHSPRKRFPRQNPLRVRAGFDRLLRDLSLVTLALAIALGWSLFRFASGVSELVATLLIDYSDAGDLLRASRLSEPLTWGVGDHVLTLGPLLRGAIELAVVLTVAYFVRGRYRRDDAADIANPSY